jgi:hypothetical protein
MLAAAARIGRSVDVPMTVDAEAGYGMEPPRLVAALKSVGAAGCNLEDTNHADGALRDPLQNAAWLRSVREAARAADYALVVNARIDVFLSDRSGGAQADLVSEALSRARAYFEAGVDCVYPIGLWQADALAAFVSDAPGPVNILAIPRAPSHAELAERRRPSQLRKPLAPPDDGAVRERARLAPRRQFFLGARAQVTTERAIRAPVHLLISFARSASARPAASTAKIAKW